MIFRNTDMCKCNIMIELKYIKVSDYNTNNNLVEEKKKEAISQLELYSKDERLDISTLKRYAIVFVGHELKVLEEL